MTLNAGRRFCQLGFGTAQATLVCVSAGVRLVRDLLLCEGCAAEAERRSGRRLERDGAAPRKDVP